MKYIIVQLSPKRFAVAEGSREEYKICTKKITRDEALKVADELRNLDPRDYSDLTKRVFDED